MTDDLNGGGGGSAFKSLAGADLSNITISGGKLCFTTLPNEVPNSSALISPKSLNWVTSPNSDVKIFITSGFSDEAGINLVACQPENAQDGETAGLIYADMDAVVIGVIGNESDYLIMNFNLKKGWNTFLSNYTSAIPGNYLWHIIMQE